MTKKRGRPSSFTQEVGDEVVERLSEGEPLRAICRDDHMPKWQTIYAWMERDPEFSARIARARELGADAIAADALRIADTPENGVETVTKADGTMETREGDMLGHRKLRIETRLKLLAKWFPQKYGERMAVDHGLSDALADRIKAARERASQG